MASGVLEGIKVLSMGQVVAIPAAGSVLADWGAEVIKLEPLQGEQTRGMVKVQGSDNVTVNWMIQVLNRNHKGLAVDLKQESGREIVYRLIEKCDVFISNYELASIRKLKLDYASLSHINPRLVYASLSGYGQMGPDKLERGYDFSAGWARSGMMYLIGEEGNPPVPPRPGMIDSISGSYVVSAVLAALLKRERTGKGQEIDLSLYHAAVWTLSLDIQAALGGEVPQKFSRTQPNNPLWNNYRTKDGRWFWMAMLQPDPCWPDFCLALERPEWRNDPRFDSLDQRAKNSQGLVILIDEVLASRTMAEWEKRFRAYNVIYGRVQSPAEVTSDPQAIANNFFEDVEIPGAGIRKMVTTPVNFHDNPASIRFPAPEIGQHTEEILLELGYNWEEIARLKEQKVIR
jgi:crotonobetainyl-CoA:carnitine CoA-transferase CaiB-like acyl-CoA transferase